MSVRTTTDPLEVAVPSPVVKDTAPPVKLCPRPPAAEKYPPMAAVVELAMPDVTEIDPPRTVLAVVSPADTTMSPPSKVLPDPMDSRKSPPLPAVALPVNILMEPVVPELAVPDVNDSMPLTPVVPAFMVFTITAPLVSVVPSPVVTDTAPPVKDSL